jgi:hypothetical protein
VQNRVWCARIERLAVLAARGVSYRLVPTLICTTKLPPKLEIPRKKETSARGGTERTNSGKEALTVSSHRPPSPCRPPIRSPRHCQRHSPHRCRRYTVLQALILLRRVADSRASDDRLRTLMTEFVAASVRLRELWRPGRLSRRWGCGSGSRRTWWCVIRSRVGDAEVVVQMRVDEKSLPCRKSMGRRNNFGIRVVDGDEEASKNLSSICLEVLDVPTIGTSIQVSPSPSNLQPFSPNSFLRVML